jgi:peptidoglycan/LPS O-acetylase OafA/YrhL
MNDNRPVEIRALAGARAFPPLILVLFHFCEGHGYRGAPWFDLPVAKGYLWVEFFFTLSGFVLTYVYASRVAEFWRGRTYFAFLKARLSRLYPLHLFMLFVILAMVIVLRSVAAHGGYVSIYDEPYHPINTWQTFIANLFLVQAWNIFGYLSWNGASWFVSVEFLLCLLFPVYLLFSRGGWWSGIVLIIGGALALAFLASPRYGLDLTFHNGIFRGMAAFAVGVGMATLHADMRAHRVEVSSLACSALQAAVLAWLLYAIYETGWSHRPQDIDTALPIMALVFVLAFDRGFLAAALQTRVPLALGEWSYAIYMGQTAVLQFLRHAQMHLYPAPTAIVFGRPWATWEPVWHWLEPALLVVVAVTWGWLLFTLIEKPANTALRKWLSTHPARGAASA